MSTSVRMRIAAAALVALLLLAVDVPAYAAPPSNDDIADATTIGGLPYEDQVDTTEATAAPDDPECAENDHTVWYAFTPTQTVELVVDTFGSDYDTTLSAYVGEPGNLEQIRCNDDFDSLQSRIRFTAEAGTRYFLMVGSFFDSPGGNLILSAQELPPRVALGIATDPTGTVDRQGLATVSGSVSCSLPVTVEVRGSLRQQVRRKRVSLGYFRTTVDCDGSGTWTADVQGQTGVYRRGDARLSASALYDDPVRGDQSFATSTQTIRLTR